MKKNPKKNYKQIGTSIGALVDEKNEAYGSSFDKSEQILNVLYPEGVKSEQYKDMLGVTRVIDKLFRIANRKDAFGENPWKDIAGYAILGCGEDKKEKDETKEVKPFILKSPH